ncbi:CFI-box-CTERM domain-containing protein [Nitrosopumilus sp.]|uniref:CFI-box-CTERM domain-containing protein n=1 Tax=Nitrosopumilus sp. TaxID=2024843 RepID=UPI003B5A613D
MKILFFLLFVILFVVTPSYAQLLSDATGLAKTLDVETDGHTFEIETISNFDIKDFDFDKDEKKLTLYIVSGLEKNLGEIIIPQNFLSGNFTFHLNDQEFFPKIKSNDSVSFITLNFTGSGNNQVEIFGTNLDGMTKKDPIDLVETPSSDEEAASDNGGGCLIATAAFGTELSSPVQHLRELRDNSLLKTNSGIAFMSFFNTFYYYFSPPIADYQRENPLFNEIVKIMITPMISSLMLLDHVDMNSGNDVLTYGSGIIFLNLMMYFAVPVLSARQLCKFKKTKLC